MKYSISILLMALFIYGCGENSSQPVSKDDSLTPAQTKDTVLATTSFENSFNDAAINPPSLGVPLPTDQLKDIQP